MTLRTSTPIAFAGWMKTARKGDKFPYHMGFLCHDRSFERTMPNGKKVTITNPEIDKIARAVWEEYENGRVVLVQQRVTTGVFEYIAVRR